MPAQEDLPPGGQGDAVGHPQELGEGDADYQQWLSEQPSALEDEDPQSRKERYKKFSEEFTTWRRDQQRKPPPAPGAPNDGDDAGRDPAPSPPASSTK